MCDWSEKAHFGMGHCGWALKDEISSWRGGGEKRGQEKRWR